jgi:pSer/pThr/pTyr-binding forkhead associated (FHA) protein/Mg-chelatase subunit ChlD
MKLLMPCGIVLGLLAVASLQPGQGQPANPPAAPNAAVKAAQPQARNGATASDTSRLPPVAAPSAPSPAESAAPAQSPAAGAVPALDIVLVLDNSGSMKQNDPHLLTRKVVTRFLDGIDADTRLGMVVFDQDARLVEPLTMLDSLNAKVRFLKGLENLNYQGRHTNSPAAIERALYELKSHGRERAGKIVIFLTDGIVDTGDKARDREKEQWLKDSLTAESRKLGIRLFTIAFTDRADYQLIQTLALKTEGEYFRAFQAKEIEGVFQAITERLALPSASPPAPAEAVAPAQPVAPGPAPGSLPVTASPPSSAAPSSPPPGLPPPLLLAGAAALVGIVALVLVMRRGAGGRAQVSGPAPAAGTVGEPPLPQAKLLDLRKSTETVLTQRRVRIGRTADNDIVIPGEGVSALHATIAYQDGAFYLEDQRSSNGTWLNDDRQRLEPHHPIRLKSGDRIRFDTCELKFLAAQQPSAGGTILAEDRTQGPTGTILTQPGADVPATPPDSGNVPSPESKPVFEPIEPPARSSNPTIPQPHPTRLKVEMCPNHPSLRAKELCSECRKPFCTQCVDELEGKTICKACQAKLAQPRSSAEP